MRLLLTSAGLCHPALVEAAEDLAGRPLSGLRAAVVPTAADVVAGDKGWLIADHVNLQRAGSAEVDIVDVSALEAEVWEARLAAPTPSCSPAGTPPTCCGGCGDRGWPTGCPGCWRRGC